MRADISSLDPAFYSSVSENYVGNNLVEPLLARDPKTGNFVARAAKSFTVSPDGLMIIFHLKPNLFWSDGKKIKASDIEYSLKRILDPTNKSPHLQKLMAIRGAEEASEGAALVPGQLGIVVENDLKLRIELKRPSSSILNVFSQPWTGAVSKSVVDRYLNKWTDPTHWVGGGVFVPQSVSNQEIVLKKNIFHRMSSLLQIDEVRIYLAKTSQEALSLYLSGKVDIFGHRDFDVPENDRARFSERADMVVQRDFFCTILRLNTTKLPFSNEKLRQAIGMAIDRELILAALGTKGETATYSIIPSGVQSYEPPSSYLYSASGAKKLLSSLGYCTREGMGDCNELPLVEILHLPSEKHRKMALSLSVLLKKNLGWKNIGIKEKVGEDFFGAVSQGAYTAALDELAVLPEHPFGFLDAFRKERSTSGGFVHREFERILDNAELSPRWEDAKKNFRHAEGILLQDGGIIPLYHGATYIMRSPSVSGFTPNIWDDHPFSQISISR